MLRNKCFSEIRYTFGGSFYFIFHNPLGLEDLSYLLLPWDGKLTVPTCIGVSTEASHRPCSLRSYRFLQLCGQKGGKLLHAGLSTPPPLGPGSSDSS